ncbi:MAG: hypothetical protein ACREMR_09005, partial [Gemmatimonadales bacterium]
MEPEPGGRWTAADLSGLAHGSRQWPGWAADSLTLADSQSWLSCAGVTPEGRRRLLRPRLLLASLCHPENFPLPRFSLAISGLARAARSTLLGHVELMDMQLGVTLDEIIERLAAGRVDVLGVSATCGQHDPMVRLLDAATTVASPPLMVVGPLHPQAHSARVVSTGRPAGPCEVLRTTWTSCSELMVLP